jgi:glycosyltransferase 2 family protein
VRLLRFGPRAWLPPWRGAPVIAAAKVAMAALLLYILTRTGALSPAALLDLRGSAAAITMALGAVLTALVLGVYRWQLVLAAGGIRLAYRRALQLYWVGAFASTLLPGAVSGDLLRAVIIARDTPGARTQAVASVVIDRVIGLLGFVVCALVLLAIRFDALRASAELRRMAVILALVLAAVLGLFMLGRRLAPRLLRRLSRSRPLGTTSDVSGARAWFGGATRQRLVTVLGISLAIPLLLTAALLPFLPDTAGPPPLIVVAIASIAAQVANTIPLTPGGIGIGEGVFEYVAALLATGTAGYATAFLSLRLVTMAINAAGGLLLLIPGNGLRVAATVPLPQGTPP